MLPFTTTPFTIIPGERKIKVIWFVKYYYVRRKEIAEYIEKNALFCDICSIILT